MVGKYFRLLLGGLLLFIGVDSFALDIQSGSSIYHFNTNSPKLIFTKPTPEHESIFGPYLTLNVGYAWQKGSTSPYIYAPGALDYYYYTPDRLRGLFEQLSFGYAFNNYISLEFGGMHFGNGSYRIRNYSGSPFTTANLLGTAYATLKTYGADALLKLSLPVEETGLSAFAAGGAAYENASFTSTNAGIPSNSINNDGISTSTVNTGFVPMLSAGVAYALSHHISLLINYDYLFSKGSITQINYNHFIPGAHIVTAGIMGTF